MKFGKTFEKTLQDEHIPESWLSSSIRYKLLKKQINKVVDEINELGLSDSIKSDNHQYIYKFTTEDNGIIEPKLYEIKANDDDKYDDEIKELKSIEISNSNAKINHEIILQKDKDFFQDLFNQYNQLNKFMRLEEKDLESKICNFAIIIKSLLENNKQKDIKIWREIFNQYIDFKLDLNSKFNLKNFENFLNHLNSTKLINGLKRDNLKIFESFYQLNYSLLKFLTFKKLNNLAIKKIIKKFDKHTSLKSSPNLTRLINSYHGNELSLISPMTIEQIISTDIIKLIPQLDDYLCPICFNIAYKPIRLRCSHFFCVRCLVKLQRQNESKCPICREFNVMDATEQNLDEQLMKFMTTNFPKEVKMKRRINDKEITDETLENLGYDSKKCNIM